MSDPKGVCPNCGHCPTCGRESKPATLQFYPWPPRTLFNGGTVSPFPVYQIHHSGRQQ